MAALGLSLGLPFSRQAVATGGYPLSFATLGLTGVDGRVIDGSEAGGFFTDSARTTGCTTSGTDPVGGITDLSGNSRHLTQTSSANKPVYIVNGGVQGYRGGLVSAVRRWMEVGSTFPAGITYYCVTKSQGGSFFTVYLIESAIGDYAVYGSTGGGPRIYTVSSGADEILTPGALSNPGVIKYVRAGTGANQSTVYEQMVDGTGASSSSGTQAGTYGEKTVYVGGDNFLNRDPQDIFFEFFAAADVGSTVRATIEAHIASRFGGLA